MTEIQNDMYTDESLPYRYNKKRNQVESSTSTKSTKSTPHIGRIRHPENPAKSCADYDAPPCLFGLMKTVTYQSGRSNMTGAKLKSEA